MKLSFSQHKWFYLPYIVLFTVCVFFVFYFTKANIHLWLNKYHSVFLDFFFTYLTYLGDGAFLPLFLLIMLFIRFRFALLLVVTFLVSGLLVQLMKRLIFEDMARPTKYFGESIQLHLVPGIHQYCCNSFPSGHSATAFGIFLCFAFVAKKNWVKLFMLICACFIAYSRVYLSQHFLIDIMIGSLIGVVTATGCYFWVYNLNYPWLNKNLKFQLHK